MAEHLSFSSTPSSSSSTSTFTSSASTDSRAESTAAQPTSIYTNINDDVFSLDIATIDLTKRNDKQSKKTKQEKSFRGRVHRMGALLWDVMEQAHNTQFGQILAKPVLCGTSTTAARVHQYDAPLE